MTLTVDISIVRRVGINGALVMAAYGVLGKKASWHELAEATGLTRHQVFLARKKLVAFYIIDESYNGHKGKPEQLFEIPEKRKLNIEKAETQVEKAETQVEKAETQVEKAETQVEKAETQVEKAETQVEKAETQVEKAETQVEKAETQVEKAETQVEKAETQPRTVTGSFPPTPPLSTNSLYIDNTTLLDDTNNTDIDKLSTIKKKKTSKKEKPECAVRAMLARPNGYGETVQELKANNPPAWLMEMPEWLVDEQAPTLAAYLTNKPGKRYIDAKAMLRNWLNRAWSNWAAAGRPMPRAKSTAPHGYRTLDEILQEQEARKGAFAARMQAQEATNDPTPEPNTLPL